MRIVRFTTGSKIKYGMLQNEAIQGLRGSPFAHFKGPQGPFPIDGSTYALNEVRLLAPCTPSKIVALGLNYRSHASEMKIHLPSTPLIFIKPSTAVIGPDAAIVLPPLSTRVDYEGELGAVIARQAKNVPLEKVKDCVLGYTCVNDVTERHIQQQDGQWTRAKGFDTFAPIGPWIDTEVNPDDLQIQTMVNGKLRQSARTSDLIFGVAQLVSFISSVMTLLPGDIIATGTPDGIGPLSPGDIVEVRIETIGILRNFVTTPNTTTLAIPGAH